MNKEAVLFALIRSVICGESVSEEVKAACTSALLEDVYLLASKHDLAHLVGQAVSKLGLPDSDVLAKCKNAAKQAFMRYMRQNYEYQKTCKVLEYARIPFMPLKGSVLRTYYPEPWLRTSCDADILVQPENLSKAINVLAAQLSYMQGKRATHDVVLRCPGGEHVELHFDLVEEGRANGASTVLSKVWETAKLRQGFSCWYEMPDELFYFYHIAHMAKHFETGGCGIRPFIDLWILDNKMPYEQAERDALLQAGGLLQFAMTARKLSGIWFNGEAEDPLSGRVQRFLLNGGVYGSTDNRVALKKKEGDGRLGYIWCRVFAPYEKLKAYYPVLEKHRWLMPVMQVRRWFMLLRPDVARRAKNEIAANNVAEQRGTDAVGSLLNDIGIHKSLW